MMSDSPRKMPVLFVGHGSPMNALEDNEYTSSWQDLARKMPKPAAILAVSAHWVTEGTRTTDEARPKMVYDMYGFPNELYQVAYPAPGAPELARITKELIGREVAIDNSWGIDHGTWSVLCRMFPAADIPVYQLSLDSSASPETHFQIGRTISALREKGVLILGSGNIVHNLGRISWGMTGGHPWAVEFDSYIKDKISQRQYDQVVGYHSAGKSAQLAVPTTEHFYPLLYVLGASREDDRLSICNDSCTLGSLSMTCCLFE